VLSHVFQCSPGAGFELFNGEVGGGGVPTPNRVSDATNYHVSGEEQDKTNYHIV